MPQVEVEGTQLETVEQGVGDPLVFVHGDLSDHRTWSAQVAALAADYRVIAYSRRYHFPNAEIDAGAANPLGRHVADLAALLATRAKDATLQKVGMLPSASILTGTLPGRGSCAS